MSFSLATFEHEVATVVSKIKAGALAVENFVANQAPNIQKDLQVGAAIAQFIPGLGPIATVVDRAGEASLGVLLKAVKDSQAIQTQVGGSGTVALTINLEQTLFNDFKQLLPAIEGKFPVMTVSTLAVAASPAAPATTAQPSASA